MVFKTAEINFRWLILNEGSRLLFFADKIYGIFQGNDCGDNLLRATAKNFDWVKPLSGFVSNNFLPLGQLIKSSLREF